MVRIDPPRCTFLNTLNSQVSCGVFLKNERQPGSRYASNEQRARRRLFVYVRMKKMFAFEKPKLKICHAQFSSVIAKERSMRAWTKSQRALFSEQFAVTVVAVRPSVARLRSFPLTGIFHLVSLGKVFSSRHTYLPADRSPGLDQWNIRSTRFIFLPSVRHF